MKQLEIEFFWPLTEQIPLDLDFSSCSPHQYYLRAQGIAGREGPFPTGMVYKPEPATWSGVGRVTIKTTELTIQTPKMPWYRKIIFKLLGFKWEPNY